nr:MAG TPA: hypothetical protein [Caudoviricetes sp.]
MSRVHESGNGRLLLIGKRLIVEDIVWLHRDVIDKMSMMIPLCHI